MGDQEIVRLHHPVAVIDALAKNRTALTVALRPIQAGAFSSVDAFDEVTDPGDPALVVVGPSLLRPEDFDRIGRLLRSRPEVRAVMVVDQLAADVLKQAIRAGVSDVVQQADLDPELLDAILRADQVLLSVEPPQVVNDEPEARVGQVTTVFSPKGGSGKSVVATNLAVALAERCSGPVVLLDADLQFGDDAVMLHMHPRHTISDVVESIDRMDLHQLKSMLAVHEPSGLLLLAAPVDPAMAERVTAADVGVILNLLRSFAAHIVVDTPSVFNDVVISLLDRSDDIVVVGGLDIPTIKNVKVGLQTLGMLEIPQNRIRLVLNRANSKVKLDVEEIERTLQLRAEALIPSDILVPTSVNRGIPAVLDAPRSGVARSLGQLAGVILAGTRREGRAA
ncbi:MAG: P-loop NTPase [Actinobacteria bacterium]|nr:P-loop NTPase [Actinomycetota bacterium]